MTFPCLQAGINCRVRSSRNNFSQLTARKQHFRDKSTVFYRFVAKLPQNLSSLYFILAFSNLPLIVAVCEPISISLSCRMSCEQTRAKLSLTHSCSLWLTLSPSLILTHSDSLSHYIWLSQALISSQGPCLACNIVATVYPALTHILHITMACFACLIFP